MQDKIIFINGNLSDLNPRSCGYKTYYEYSNTPPAISAFTSINYVAMGKGTVTKDNRSFEIKKGDIFIIKKGETAQCSPANDTSLSYYFISFDGSLASDFEAIFPVFHDEESNLEKIGEIEATSAKSISLLSAYLFEIYSKYCTLEKNNPDNYVDKIKAYIESNYQNDIRIEHILSFLHLSRAYIARIFKKRTGMTITEYLNVYRLNQAEQLLKSGKSITETAYLCGFGDLSNFSKNFKKHIGISPKKYRAEHKGDIL